MRPARLARRGVAWHGVGPRPPRLAISSCCCSGSAALAATAQQRHARLVVYLRRARNLVAAGNASCDSYVKLKCDGKSAKTSHVQQASPPPTGMACWHAMNTSPPGGRTALRLRSPGHPAAAHSLHAADACRRAGGTPCCRRNTQPELHSPFQPIACSKEGLGRGAAQPAHGAMQSPAQRTHPPPPPGRCHLRPCRT
jgi:hypothetical protein